MHRVSAFPRRPPRRRDLESTSRTSLLQAYWHPVNSPGVPGPATHRRRRALATRPARRAHAGPARARQRVRARQPARRLAPGPCGPAARPRTPWPCSTSWGSSRPSSAGSPSAARSAASSPRSGRSPPRSSSPQVTRSAHPPATPARRALDPGSVRIRLPAGGLRRGDAPGRRRDAGLSAPAAPSGTAFAPRKRPAGGLVAAGPSGGLRWSSRWLKRQPSSRSHPGRPAWAVTRTGSATKKPS